MTAALLARPALAPARGPRIRIFNVKYSPNLGDGLLSECLEQALRDCGADPDSWSVDLAGRTSYAGGAPARRLQMQVLRALPGPVRNLAVRAPLAVQSRRRWAPHYARSLEGAECVVIGGGNLIADLDLNFPTKISLALAAAAWRRLPVFIYGCGVSAGWSRQGLSLLERAVGRGNIRKVWVRDERSRDLWNRLVGSKAGLETELTRDPGLLAVQRYGMTAERSRNGAPIFGLNVTSPLAVQYHADHAPSAGELDRWYLALGRALLQKGYRLAVFSNGSPEDREYAAKLHKRFQDLGAYGRVSFPTADTPAELTALIAGCDAIAAFRMHAIIAAYSCGVPFLALAWDAKLASFVQSVNREDWLCTPVATAAPDAAQMLINAAHRGIPSEERANVISEARHGVEHLFSEILHAVQ